jgi:hypothetical protein
MARSTKGLVPSNEVADLMLQALEHEKGGVKIYETALTCVLNEDLKDEWTKYLEETTRHVEVMNEICSTLGLDVEQQTPGRAVVRHMGEALVAAMEMARQQGAPEAAQLVACECVVLAETKDHLNWELLSKCAELLLEGEAAEKVSKAVEEVEDQEDEHLYHSKGWCRELWISTLGMTAVLPPPEEQKDVKTAIGAAHAQQSAEAKRMSEKRGRTPH